MATYELLSFTRLLEPVHGMAFNPWDAGELACVGPGAVTLWLVQQHGADISLQVHRDPIPEEVAAGTLTSVCYGTVPLLYGGSNTGQVWPGLSIGARILGTETMCHGVGTWAAALPSLSPRRAAVLRCPAGQQQ